MKSKKGFTLIELLAIIVILAIIAVITVPIVLNIIENSKKGAATDSAYGYKDAVHTAYVDKLVTNNDLKLNDTYTVESDGSLSGNFNDLEVTRLSITLSGTVPSSGELTYENNKFIEGWLVIGDYRVTFNDDETVTTEKDADIVSIAIGTDIDYSTTLNGVTLDNWKVFYSKGSYTYLIYGYYVPNSALINSADMSPLVSLMGSTYCVYTLTNRVDLIDVLSDKSKWDSLLTGTLYGNSISETRKSNIWAMGAPSLELWIASWNESHSDRKVYYTKGSQVMSDGLYGYYAGDSDHPETLVDENNSDFGFVVPMYDLASEELYFASTTNAGGDWCMGTWTVSASADDDDHVYVIDAEGGLYPDHYDGPGGNGGIRPIIKLPTKILMQYMND